MSIRVKCKVYRAVVATALLYGAETWAVYHTQVMILHDYIMMQQRTTQIVAWEDKVANKETCMFTING